MPDFDRYLASCEARDADRRLSDEDQREDDLMSAAEARFDEDRDNELTER